MLHARRRFRRLLARTREEAAGDAGASRSIDDWAYGEWCYVRDTGAIECSGDHADDLGKTLPTYADAIEVVRVEQSVACVLRKGGEMSCFGRPEGGADRYPKRADQISEKCLRSGDAVSCFAWSESASEWMWQPRAVDGKVKETSGTMPARDN